MDAASLSLWPRISVSAHPFLLWLGFSILLSAIISVFFWQREAKIFPKISLGLKRERKSLLRVHPRYLLAWFPILGMLLSFLIQVPALGGFISIVWLTATWVTILYSVRQGDFDWLRSYSKKSATMERNETGGQSEQE